MAKNRIIITWKRSMQIYPPTIESFRCTSRAGARKLVSKRTRSNIKKAIHYNEHGTPQDIV